MEIWFYSGTCMQDGTPITIAARSLFEEAECLRKGLKPLVKKKKISRKAAPSAGLKKK